MPCKNRSGRKPNPLTFRQKAFAREYVKRGNATEAYIQAGYSASTRQVACAEGYKLLRKPIVSAEVARLAKLIEEQTVEDTAVILSVWQKALMFDAREMSSLHRDACRYCHGKGHKYHWRIPAEFEEQVGEWAALSENAQAITKAPNDAGGYGYRSTLVPHPDCPMCDGYGHEKVIFHDTRGYSQAAAVAYEGVSVTGNGMKIKTLDRLAASEKLAKHLGMFRGEKEEKVVDGLVKLISEIQQRGSKAPLGGLGDAPMAPEDGKKLYNH